MDVGGGTGLAVFALYETEHVVGEVVVLGACVGEDVDERVWQ